MSRRNEFVTGLLTGSILPLTTGLVFGVLFKSLVVFDRPALPYLITIALNLFLLRYYVRHDKEIAGRGVMIVTFIFAIAAFYFKIKL
jgi:hypothetical protein